MTVRIEIYTKLYCSYCQRAKELLRIKGIDFVEHDITDAGHATAQRGPVVRERTVPEIFVNDVLIGGCAELFDLDEKGELDLLLGQAVTPCGSFR